VKPRAAWTLAGALLIATATTGCFNPFAPSLLPERVVEVPPPVPNSPRNLLLLFEWAYERQDITVYEELFTDDYRFTFADEDAAANPPLTREDELLVARHLFIAGSATEPPANRITLDYVGNLFAQNDARPGKESPWHKQITVRVVLRVETVDLTHQVDGTALFYMVRGDSAQIPEDLQLRGLEPDPNRWYIEGWVDQTGGIGVASGVEAAAAAPSEAGLEDDPYPPALNVTWSRLKLAYLDRLPAARAP